MRLLWPSRVMFAGLDSWLPAEDEAIRELGLASRGSSRSRRDVGAGAGLDRRAAHRAYRRPGSASTFSIPLCSGPSPSTARAARLTPAITEHMPWDTLAMRNMLRQLPLMSS